jgi:hypothetical protein
MTKGEAITRDELGHLIDSALTQTDGDIEKAILVLQEKSPQALAHMRTWQSKGWSSRYGRWIVTACGNAVLTSDQQELER